MRIYHLKIFRKNVVYHNLVQNYVDTKPAKYYEFKLDKFQERAVLCLENGQSVLVAAHTSAGKTAVAQYAIAMALRDKQRVIYTSPIKALSNQKYRELQHEFNDVGLMTGDVTINESASCLVMTTEILRNMLYRGSEVTREMAWVIFDEVHYMRDKERGVVWEETMILLPNFVKYVFLSATIPNAREFAQWICKIKNQPCNVVYTDYRPVPLQHYVYVTGAEGIYLVVDEKGNFKEENFNKAIAIVGEDYQLDKILEKKSKKKQNVETDMRRIITLIHENNLSPAIVFSFSKKDCETNAMSLAKLDLTSDEEKELIEKIYTSAISTLSEEDQLLPQIQLMLPLLKKGVGIHHGGLLPIVKEAVELIFQESLVKVLFSTETFSMGINMPAKTVVFTSIEKFDGEEYRWLGGGEYIQMSGRAGRRGLDDRGITIMMLNKKMDVDVCKNILNGKSDPLFSTFHLSYNMLVNLMRVEGIDPEYIIKRSFHQFQSERTVPQIKKKVKELDAELSQFNQKYGFNSDEEKIKELLDIRLQIEKYENEISKIVTKPNNAVPFLAAGRLIKIRGWGWGVCVNITKKNIELMIKNKKFIFDNMNSDDKTFETYIIDTLLYVKNTTDADSKLLPGDMSKDDGMLGVVPVIINSLENLSCLKINMSSDLKDRKVLKNMESILNEIFRRFKSNIPLLDPIKDMNLEDSRLEEIINKVMNLKKTEEETCFIPKHQIELFKDKKKIIDNINSLLDNLKKCKDLVLKDDLKNMKRVLKRLEFVTEDTVTRKGQVACQISTSDEVLLTEMLFNGSFNNIEPNYLCSMLSCFLVNEGGSKNDTKPPKDPRLTSYNNIIKENAGKVADILIDSKINISRQEYIDSFKTDIMEVTLEWANGSKFSDICKLTEVYEGIYS
jgi:ATP-dependent RNA helicase DOB1